MPKMVDLTGQRFGKLTVIQEYGREKNGVVWLCQCDCGNTRRALTGNLRAGHTTSCGCSRAERSDAKMYTVGDTTLSLKGWAEQCVLNPNRLDARLRKGMSMEEAIDQLMTPGDFRGKNRIRKPVSEKKTKKPTNFKNHTIGDKTLSTKEWAEQCGVKINTLYGRMYGRQMSFEDALTTPLKCVRSTVLTGQRFGKLTVVKEDHRDKKGINWLCKCDCGNTRIVPTGYLHRGITTSCGCSRVERTDAKMYTVGDTTLSLKGWAEQCGINQPTIQARLKKGMSMEEAISALMAKKIAKSYKEIDQISRGYIPGKSVLYNFTEDKERNETTITITIRNPQEDPDTQTSN